MRTQKKSDHSFLFLVMTALGLIGWAYLIAYLPVAKAQDTYNFYFQKGAGAVPAAAPPPQTPAPLAPVPTPNPPPAAVPTPQQVVEPSEEELQAKKDRELLPDRWWFGVGGSQLMHERYLSNSSGESMSGRSLGVRMELGHSFNPFVAIVAGGSYQNPQGSRPGRDARVTTEQAWLEGGQGDVSLLITPVRLKMFRWDSLNIGVLAGATYLSSMSVGDCRGVDMSRADFDCGYGVRKRDGVTHHFGARATINLDRSLGLVADYRVLGGGHDLMPKNIHMASVGFNFNF